MPDLLSHSSTDEHLEYSLNLAVVDSALVNVDVQRSSDRMT